MPIRLTVLLSIFAADPLTAAGPVSFARDVAPILSRAGCNAGACHGNFNGKGGFRLSLRGQDPAFDFARLTRDMLARRVDPTDPDASLVLQKASGKVSHEGGMRFGTVSPEYKTVRAWIAAGCPDDTAVSPKLTALTVAPGPRVLVDPADRVQLSVAATFADGSTRDVTTQIAVEQNNIGVAKVTLAGEVVRQRFGETLVIVRYLTKMVPVRIAFIPNRPVPAMPPSDHPIDKALFEQFVALRLRPSDLCSDDVFLRRAFLDTTGNIPTAAEARAFLADANPDKRTKLIDDLLTRPEFAENWAAKWSDLLRNEEKSLDKKGTQAFSRWLRAWFAEDKPLTELARVVLSGRGSTYANPAANFYRAVRDPYLRAEAAAQVFLGVRVGCARCHNHPFDRWTQDDYHRFAAAFARIDYQVLENKRKDSLDKHEFVGEQVVIAKRSGSLPHPRGGVAEPKRLGAAPITSDDPLGAVADWVASPDNPYFAKAQANRVWLHLFGKGLVDPNDDFRTTNPPTHPAVLDLLTKKFAAGGYRLKPLVRFIMTSRAYQLSSTPNESNAADESYLSKAIIQPLKAEQLLDALSRAMDVPVKFSGYPLGTRATQVAAPMQSGSAKRFGSAGGAERFLKVFGKPERLLTCECERNEDAGMMQSFQLITGELLNGLLREKENRIGKLMAANASPTQMLDDLYVATLSRPPTASEAAGLLDYVEKAKNKRTAWEDVAWGLVNAKEFLLRR
ncbi:MAG TPA: DUF1549 and DUF1553 domain-containing protein [Fimbriiglobus sp.]|jgi:hypothetical protein